MRLRLAHLLSAVGLVCAFSADALTYYVKNGGNDSADGRSDATAWASLSKVNAYSFAAGDRVLFREGHRWVGVLTVDWAGTTTEKAVVGAYYLDGSTAVRGYRSALPIIDGEDRLPTSGHYNPLVVVTAPRVRVENLRVQNSEGRGIGIVQVDEAEVVGCSVSNMYNSGIHFYKSKGSRAETNFVTVAGIGNRDDGAPWGASIDIASSTSTVVRGNTVAEVWGEGINAHSGSQYTLIENNRVFGVRAVGIYSDAAPDTTIRRNIVFGTSNSAWWRTATAVGAGIALNNERYHFPVGGGSQSVSVQTQRTKVYGNLVAYTSSGIAMWGHLEESSFNDVLIYNNTLVDNNVQVTMNVKPKPGGRFSNNILLSISSGTRDVEGTSLNGMIAKNNYFSQGDPGGDYVNAGNRFTGLRLAKMSGWRAVNSRDQINWKDFIVASGSPVIGAGDDEPWRTSTTAQDYRLDHNAAEFKLPMDMGGLTFATPTTPRPMAPTGLSGT
jgi:parallel beta-helix repeat protein